METNRNEDTHFKQGRSALFVTACIAIMIVLSGCEAHKNIVNMIMVRRDKNGNKPQDIAIAFIKAAQKGNCDEAARYWTKDSINVFNHHPIEHSFERYCRKFSQSTFYEVSKAGPGKSGHYWMGFEVRTAELHIVDEGMLYCTQLGHVWFLTESPGGSFSNRRSETEPHAVVKIMPAVIESRHDSEGQVYQVTISINRIDHGIIQPHPGLLEKDGSVVYRVAPGSHDIEYREMIGELAEQNISFVTKTLVTEEGDLYILEGYATERQKLTDE